LELPERNMKALCMFALVGLVAAAPQRAVVPGIQDQEVVISQIMLSLQPAIDAAIAGALGETSVTTVTVEETTGPVRLTGSLGDSSFDGSFQSQQSSFSSNYNSGSNLNNEVNAQQQLIGQQIQATSQHLQNQHNSLAQGVSGASYHETGYPHTHDNQQQQQFAIVPISATISGSQTGNVASNVGSNPASSVSTTSDSQRVQLDASTAKRVQQQKIVSAVIGSLTPSIEEAVMNALMANMATTQTQSSFSSTSTQSDAGFTSTSVSSSSSSSSEQVLITRIIEALTPSITAAVRKALQERYEAQQAALLLQQQQQEALLLQQQQQEALLIQQQQAAAFQASQQAQQSSSVSQSELIAQIVAALKPSIAVSVQDALNAGRFQQQQQQQQQQQVFQSQVSNAASQQSSSVSSGTLTNIFGESGSAHNVKVETPEFNYEYNTRK